MRFIKLSDSKQSTHKEYIMAYPLHDAAISGDLDKTRKLLQSGKYDVNMLAGDDRYTRTALHFGLYLWTRRHG